MSKQLSRKKRGMLWGLLVLTSLVLVFSISAYAYLQSMLNLIDRDDTVAVINPEDEVFETNDPGDFPGKEPIDEPGPGEDPNSEFAEPPKEENPEGIQWPEDGDVIRDKDVINILLIGQDKRPGETRGRSDAMMIASMNKKTGSIKIISLMRDMYVQIPGYSDNRINASYAFGGRKLLNQTIVKNFLIHIDGSVEVDFEGFVKGIDAIGGINIPISQKEAEHLSQQGYPELAKGKVKMNGKLALAYARIRKIDSDFGRTQRQRKVIQAAFSKAKNSGVSGLMSLTNKVLPYVKSDLSNDQLINLGVTAVSSDVGKIEQHGIPVKDSYRNAWIRKMLVLVPDLTKNREAVKDIIYGD